MNDTPNKPRFVGEVVGPLDALSEPVLAVDLARAELDTAITTAHRFPRRIDICVQRIEQMALYDEAAAGRCIYSLPRADKAIIGPSIGFANVLATAWGNCRDGGRLLRIDRAEKLVIAEGAFFDLESNRQTNLTATRRISTSKGLLYSDDMIAIAAQAAISVARRNAILNGVPRPLWWPIYERALIIVRGTVETLSERRDKLIAAFAAYGITPERLAMALGVKERKDITIDHIVMLRGMYEALRDGSESAEDLFDPRRMTSGSFDRVENPLEDEQADEPSGPAPKRAAEVKTETVEVRTEAPAARQE